eukprot:m.37164 g.37164  ORF g.37164 m.37164 type:complete len:502 (-) comp9268_c0_seq1:56-1561(-)
MKMRAFRLVSVSLLVFMSVSDADRETTACKQRRVDNATCSLNLGALSAIAMGDYSTVLGATSLAQGVESFATGYKTQAIGSQSTAMGSRTEAHDMATTALGFQTKAYGSFSTVFGHGCTTFEEASVAMGDNTNAIGKFCTAMGSKTFAYNRSSTAMGESTRARGAYSVAMGLQSEAKGEGSVALGHFTTAKAKYSIAMGDSTETNTYAETVVGRWNEYDSLKHEHLFTVGNGFNFLQRSDAFYVTTEGDSYIQRDLYIGNQIVNITLLQSNINIVQKETNEINAKMSTLKTEFATAANNSHSWNLNIEKAVNTTQQYIIDLTKKIEAINNTLLAQQNSLSSTTIPTTAPTKETITITTKTNTSSTSTMVSTTTISSKTTTITTTTGDITSSDDSAEIKACTCNNSNSDNNQTIAIIALILLIILAIVFSSMFIWSFRKIRNMQVEMDLLRSKQSPEQIIKQVHQSRYELPPDMAPPQQYESIMPTESSLDTELYVLDDITT